MKTMPPLPPAAVDEHNLQGGRLLYTRQQMQAYGQSYREQALEEAASVCEAAIASIWDYHDDGRKQIGTTVCNNLAAAIRKIKEQP